jgi:hypothetical protein
VSVSRRNRRAVEFVTRLGFELAEVDDLENHFACAAPARQAQGGPDGQGGPVAPGRSARHGARG